MVEFIRDVVIVLAFLMSLFAVAYHAPGEWESARNALLPSLSFSMSALAMGSTPK